MHALEFAGRHLSPTSLPQIIEAMAGRDDEVKAALAASRTLDWPERLKPVRACLEPAAEAAAAGIAALRSAGEAPQPIVAAYRADAQLRPGRAGDLSHGGVPEGRSASSSWSSRRATMLRCWPAWPPSIRRARRSA